MWRSREGEVGESRTTGLHSRLNGDTTRKGELRKIIKGVPNRCLIGEGWLVISGEAPVSVVSFSAFSITTRSTQVSVVSTKLRRSQSTCNAGSCVGNTMVFSGSTPPPSSRLTSSLERYVQVRSCSVNVVESTLKSCSPFSQRRGALYSNYFYIECMSLKAGDIHVRLKTIYTFYILSRCVKTEGTLQHMYLVCPMSENSSKKVNRTMWTLRRHGDANSYQINL